MAVKKLNYIKFATNPKNECQLSPLLQIMGLWTTELQA